MFPGLVDGITPEDLDEVDYSQEPEAIFRGLGQTPDPVFRGLGQTPEAVFRGVERLPLPRSPEVEAPCFDALKGRLYVPSTGERLGTASPITGFVARWPSYSSRPSSVSTKASLPDTSLPDRSSSATPTPRRHKEYNSRGLSSQDSQPEKNKRREIKDMTGNTIVSLRECSKHTKPPWSREGPATLAFSVSTSPSNNQWDGLANDHMGGAIPHLSPLRTGRNMQQHGASYILGLGSSRTSSAPTSARGSHRTRSGRF